MADLPPPYLASMAGGQPDAGMGDAYIKAQMQQMIAQMLLQNGQQGTRAPESWNSMKLVPKLSPLSGLAGVASTLLGGAAYKKGLQSQNDYFNRFYGSMNGPDQSQPTTLPMQTQVPLNPDNPTVGAGSVLKPDATDADITHAGPVQQVPNPMAQQGGSAGEIPGFPNMTPQKARMWMQMPGVPPGYQEYAKQYLEAVAKYNTLSGGERPGMPIKDARGRITGYAPIPEQGIGFNVGPNGEPIPYQIPGMSEMVAGAKGEARRADTANSFTTVTDQFGHPQPVLGSTIMGGPGVQPQPPPQKYFPSTASTGRPPAGGGAPQDQNPYFPGAPKYQPANTIYASPTQKGEDEWVLKEKQEGIDSGKAAANETQKVSLDNMNLATQLGKAYTGPGQDTRKLGASALVAFGLAPEDVANKLSAAITADKLATVIGTEAAKAELGTGQRMAQQEWSVLLNRGAVNVALPIKSSADILTIRETINQYRQQKEAARIAYIRDGYDPRYFDDGYNKAHPLQQFAMEHVPQIQHQFYSTMGVKLPPPPEGAAALDAAMRKYGRKQ